MAKFKDIPGQKDQGTTLNQKYGSQTNNM